MKKAVLVAAACCAVMCGCMSDRQAEAIAQGYGQFISQERYMPLQVFDFGTNGNGTVTYTGLVSLRTYAPLDKLSVMPEQPGALREIVDGAVRVSGIAAAAYGVHELSNTRNKTVINTAAE